MFPFKPPKNNRNPKVFWYFQGDQKWAVTERFSWRFSYWYVAMGDQILAPKKMKYTFIYTIILHRRLFVPFKPK